MKKKNLRTLILQARHFNVKNIRWLRKVVNVCACKHHPHEMHRSRSVSRWPSGHCSQLFLVMILTINSTLLQCSMYQPANGRQKLSTAGVCPSPSLRKLKKTSGPLHKKPKKKHTFWLLDLNPRSNICSKVKFSKMLAMSVLPR